MFFQGIPNSKKSFVSFLVRKIGVHNSAQTGFMVKEHYRHYSRVAAGMSDVTCITKSHKCPYVVRISLLNANWLFLVSVETEQDIRAKDSTRKAYIFFISFFIKTIG